MFGRRKKRSTFLPFVIFRLLLSLVMFTILLVGAYSAYKYFSGFDPISTDPKAIISSLLNFIPADLKKFKPQLAETKEVKSTQSQPSGPPAKQTGKLLFTFGLLADSHSDNELLKKALEQMGEVKFVIGLGDYTDVGTLEELQNAKKIFDEGKIRYFVIPGDHDLWDSRDKQKQPTANFSQVFGPPWQSFEFEGVGFLLLDNSDNYRGFGDTQIQRLEEELERFKKSNIRFVLAFVHEPLSHPSSDHIMGRVESNLKDQAQNVIKILKTGGVKKVFAGDIHFFSQYNEPSVSLPMTTVGAVSTQRNSQSPRFARVGVFEDGTTLVEDVEIMYNK